METLKSLTEKLLKLTYPNYPDEHTKDSAKRIAEYYEEIMQFALKKKELEPQIKNMSNTLQADKFVIDELLKITSFENKEIETENYNGLFIGPIKIYSVCAHHYAPMFGDVYIALDINDTLLGLSKYARIAKLYARQPIVQEIYTSNLAHILSLYLPSSNILVVSKLRHLCMESRGSKVETSETLFYKMIGDSQKNMIHLNIIMSQLK